MQTLTVPSRLTTSALSGLDVLALIADSVICADEQGRILLFNRAAEQTFGYRADEVVGRPVEMLIPQHFRAWHAGQVRSFARGKGEVRRLMGHRREVCGLRKNSEEFPAEATVSRQTIHNRAILTVVVRDITERKALEDERKTISREADHRIKNLFSVVNSLVSLTARTATDIDAFKEALLNRLSALARTQKALWLRTRQNTTLNELLADELAQYRRPDGANIVIEGPEVFVNPKVAQTFALAFHELATNSAKYGALSDASGRVAVTSAFTDDNQLLIEWQETGGPRIKPPTRQGFGTLLIKQLINRAFRADVDLEYSPQGFVCRMNLPRATVEAAPDS